MYTNRARNVQSAYIGGMQIVRSHGVREETRNGPALVVPVPVMTIYDRPIERVLLDRQRDANPTFHLMESVWLLAGRRDVASLDLYNHSLKKYSDDGVSYHGAYGHRWRRHFINRETVPDRPADDGPGETIDQLATIIEMLRRNPDDRRIVLQMWDASVDLDRDGADFPCLAGDTVLWSTEGDLPISTVADKFRSGEVTRWPVYSVDPETGEQRISWATDVWKSGIKRTIKLVYDDGSSMRLTHDHRLYVRTGPGGRCREILAGDLKPGDRVLATRRFKGPKGHEMIKRSLRINTSYQNMQFTHRSLGSLLWKDLSSSDDVHHLDENKQNNRQDNLERLGHGEHSSLHRSGDGNPMRRMTPEQHAARGRKHSAALKASWARLTPEERKQRSGGYARDNHVVVSVEDGEMEDVFDFTVPGHHTAVVGTGIVAHNCNNLCYFRSRRTDAEGHRSLDMTIVCRSNDAILGAFGANAVHFSVLQELVAMATGHEVGTMYQLSNNLHVYTDTLDRIGGWPRASEDTRRLYGHRATPQSHYLIPTPIFRPCVKSTVAQIFEEIEAIWDNRQVEPHVFSDDGLSTILYMQDSYSAFRAKNRDTARRYAALIPADDWRMATTEWLERRYVA